jgi:hypothetical protein
VASNDINGSDGSIGNSKETIVANISNNGSDNTNSPEFYIPPDTPPEVLA